MPRVDLPGFECSRCGHQWFARGEGVPRVCPRCKSPLWDVPRNTGKTTPKISKPKPWELP